MFVVRCLLALTPATSTHNAQRTGQLQLHHNQDERQQQHQHQQQEEGHAKNMKEATLLLLAFSVFVQAANGSWFAITPYITKSAGT